MVRLHEDQAAGLRRLFAAPRATVVAVLGGPVHAPQAAVACARALAASGEPTLLIDERRGAINAQGLMGVATRYDFAQCLAGHVRLEQARARAGENLWLVPARTPVPTPAAAVAGERLVTRYRWIVVDAAQAESAFAVHATHALLVVGHDRGSITEGYGRLKRLAQRAQRALPTLAVIADASAAGRVYANLSQAGERHFARQPEFLGAVADAAGAGTGLARRLTEAAPPSSFPTPAPGARAVALQLS